MNELVKEIRQMAVLLTEIEYTAHDQDSDISLFAAAVRATKEACREWENKARTMRLVSLNKTPAIALIYPDYPV